MEAPSSPFVISTEVARSAIPLPLTSAPAVATLPFVIPTEAYPDFLLRAAGDDDVCGFPKENRMMLINARDLDRKSGGTQ
jgi:hypothetical protein